MHYCYFCFSDKDTEAQNSAQEYEVCGYEARAQTDSRYSINGCWINIWTARKWPVKADQLAENNKTFMKPKAWFYFHMIYLIYFCFITTVASLSSPVSPDKPMHEEAVSLLELTL